MNEMAAMPAARRQAALEAGESLRRNGSTALYLLRGETPAGVLIASDELRPEAPAALDELRALGLGSIELLTGDQPAAAAELAGQLGIAFRAGLLPEDKIRIVKEYQAAGRRVLMIGDGVNDAPALAQADVGMAMAAAGSDIAVEAADLTLLRDDWRLVPQAILSARRTMGVIRGNIWFTAVYNLVGLTLAAFGILPPILAAAAQSLPDLGILLNSSRLLRR
jgi:Cd2+/Zn2+-exporting ATPase/Cu+-exporting ATPase